MFYGLTTDVKCAGVLTFTGELLPNKVGQCTQRTYFCFTVLVFDKVFALLYYYLIKCYKVTSDSFLLTVYFIIVCQENDIIILFLKCSGLSSNSK